MQANQLVQNCIMLSANDIAELRRCDVFRVLDAAHECDVLAEAVAFIETARPDLADDAAECRSEIVEADAGGSHAWPQVSYPAVGLPLV